MSIFPAGCVSLYGIHCECPRLRNLRGQQDSLVPHSLTLIILQWMDYFCSFIDSDLSWRLPLFVQCVIGAILAVGSLILPESPRWVS
jgi:Sugar (and other) transporter